jgi:hypothetical protein
MRSLAKTLLIAVTLAALAGPGKGGDGAGGMAEGCRSVTDGEVKQQISELRELSREQLWPSMQAALVADDEDFAEMSDPEQDIIWGIFRESLVKGPSVMLSFCDHFARGAVPGIGTGAGHGTLEIDWEFKLGKDGEPVTTAAKPDAGDCEKPYSVTVEFDEGGKTKHIFCEAASGFVPTSSHRAGAAGGWTRIE